MPEYLTPGVYIEEIEIGAKPIEGVSTSTAAFLGRTERGPLEPRLITSFDQFQKLYGGYLPDSFLAYEVEGFFRNGGSRCYIARIAGGSSNPAKFTATKELYHIGKVMRVKAAAPGANGNNISVKIDGPSGTDDPFTFVLTVDEPVEQKLSADPNTTSTEFPYYQLSAVPNVTLSNKSQGRPQVIPKTALKGGSDSAKAYLELIGDSGTTVMKVEAIAPGADGDNIYVQIDNAPSGTKDPLAFILTVYVPVKYTLNADPSAPNYYAKPGNTGSAVILNSLDSGRPKALSKTDLKGGSASVKAFLDLVGDIVQVMKVEAASPGDVGNKISVEIKDASNETKDPLAFALTVYSSDSDMTGKRYTLSADPKTTSTEFPYYAKSRVGPDAILSFLNTGKPQDLDKTQLKGGSIDEKASLKITGDIPISSAYGPVLTISALGPGTSGNKILISVQTAGLSRLDAHLFKLVVSYNKIEEVYDNLSIESSSSDYYLNRVNGISHLIVISPGDFISRPDDLSDNQLTGGDDVTPVIPNDYEGYVIDDKTGKRTGWLALDRINDISIYCEPVESESTQKSLTESVINHCELMKDRFAVLQTPQGTTSDIANLFPPIDSKYAALYHPWIGILDPLTDLPKYVPPAGHIAGIYARTDGLRGVHKAPANETVSGIVDLKFDIQKGEQDILNPRGVNCIRAFQGQGIKVWGARTISRDPLWKYVNVRRLFIYLEKSINQGTQWVVFEPNNEALWSRVKQTISQFLTTVWRSGALMGSTEDEAFFVKCDRTTMTQDDIDNGRLIVVVGVAPVKPAEFVIFRIAQVANAANTE